MNRELMIEIMSKGSEQTTKDIESVGQAVEGINTASEQQAKLDEKRDARLKKFNLDRLRESRAYQQANASLNGQLDVMVDRSERAYKNLFNMRNLTFTGLAAGIGYLAYQFKELDKAGQNVNSGLDTMSIKLTSTIKKSKGLSSYSQAKDASKEYVDWARKYAASTPFEQTEVISAMSNLAPSVKGDLSKTQKAVRVASVLNAMDPAQGFEGAVFAIREALSGSYTSLSQRFELPKSIVTRYKTGGRDTLDAMLAGLESMGYTEDMVTRIGATPEGMRSNISDSRNFLAGNMNAPMYAERNRALYNRMTGMGGWAEANGGVDRGLQMTGQGVAMLMQRSNMAKEAMMRPVTAVGRGFANALAPGFNRAKLGMEKASLLQQESDYASRVGTLTSAEMERYREIRRRLRELPSEMKRADREADALIRKTGTYIGKVLGLSDSETKLVVQRLLKVSEDFKKFVARAQDSFKNGPIAKFMDFIGRSMQSAGRSFARMMLGLKEVGSSGVFADLRAAGSELFKALAALGGAVASGLFKALGITGTTLADGGSLLAKGLVDAVKLITPLVTLITKVTTAMVKTITWAVEKVNSLIDKGGGLIEGGLRLFGRNEAADQIAAMREPNRPAAQGSAEQPTGPSTTEKVAGGIGAAGMIGAALGSLGMLGMATRTREVWNQGRAAGGIWGGIKAMGGGLFTIGQGGRAQPPTAGGPGSVVNNVRTPGQTVYGPGGRIINLAEPPPRQTIGQRLGNMGRTVATGARNMANPKDLLKGKGLGANLLSVGLNAIFPGNPLVILYTIVTQLQNIRMLFGGIGKLFGAFGRMVTLGIKTMFKNIGGVPKALQAGITNIGKLFGGMAKAGASVGKFMTKAGATIAGLIGKIPVVGPKLLAALGLAGAYAPHVQAAVGGWSVGRWLGGRDNGDGTGRTVNEYTQDAMLKTAANSPAVAKLSGIDHEGAKSAWEQRRQELWGKKEPTAKETATAVAAALPLLYSDGNVLNASTGFMNRLNPGTDLGGALGGGNPSGAFGGGAGNPSGAFGGAVSSAPNAERKKKFDEVMAAAKAAGDPHPEVTAAQWALESAWGTKTSGANNYFGIKGKGTMVNTTEVINGKRVATTAEFQDYGSLSEGIAAKVALTNNGRYTQAGYKDAQTPFAAADALRRGGYATDPEYATKLGSIMAGMGINPNGGVSPMLPAGKAGPTIQTGAVTITSQNPLDALKQGQTQQYNDAAKQLAAALGGR